MFVPRAPGQLISNFGLLGLPELGSLFKYPHPKAESI
jgi:hypothetical protein